MEVVVSKLLLLWEMSQILPEGKGKGAKLSSGEDSRNEGTEGRQHGVPYFPRADAQNCLSSLQKPSSLPAGHPCIHVYMLHFFP